MNEPPPPSPHDDVILNNDLTQRLTKLDETRLNQAIKPNVSAHVLNNLFRQPLPRASKQRTSVQLLIDNSNIPRCLQAIVVDLKLHDEHDFDRRVQMFIGYCLYRNYSLNTVQRYFMVLKRHGVFGRGAQQSSIRPDPAVFSDRGRVHTRIVSMENFKKLVWYLHQHLSQYTAPILIAVYTGLRTAEILQFTTYNLYQLSKRLAIISIKRKQTVVRDTGDDNGDNSIYWQPVYTSHLCLFIDILIALYQNQYDALLNNNQNSKLFYCTPKTLGNRIRHLYYNACDVAAPNGFGVHSCRNLIAQIIAQNTDNIVAIQAFLQHRNINTTRRYIKADFTKTSQTFNRLTNYEFSKVRANIAVPPK